MSSSTVLKVFGFLIPIIAVLLGLAHTNLWPSVWLPNASSGNVEDSGPKVYNLSDDPVVVYVKDFISTEEAAHLVRLA